MSNASDSEMKSAPSTRKRKPSKPAHDGWNGQTVHADEPVPGFYRVTVRVEGSGWVSIPARLWKVSGERDEAGDLIEDEVFAAHIGGISWPVWDNFWPYRAKHKITRDEYIALYLRKDKWQSHLTKLQSES